LQGKKHGKGKCIETWEQGGKTRKLIYDGEWKDSMKHGKGVGMYYNCGFKWIKYEGDWNNQYKEGKGIMNWSSGRKYIGEFKKNKKHGKGVETKFVGEDSRILYKGDWVEDDLINGDYHLYQDGTYYYTQHNSSDSPDGSENTKTVEDETEALEGLKEFNKVQENFSREGFGKRRKKIRKKKIKRRKKIRKRKK